MDTEQNQSVTSGAGAKTAFSSLRSELEAIASDELGDVLDNWENRTQVQDERLRRYLSAELEGYGMLSLEQLRVNDSPAARIRREARAILRA